MAIEEIMEAAMTMKSIDKAVGNLADKPTKTMGNTLDNILFLVFGDFNHDIDKRRLKYDYDLKAFEQTLMEKVEQIPVEKRIEPDLQTVAPALEAAKYCVEHEDLRIMFANLIATSMNQDTKNVLHPSFSEIIKQMNPLDATNFKLFKNRKFYPVVTYIFKDSKGSATFFSNAFLANKNQQDINIQAVSLNVLERLGLIQINYNEQIDYEAEYEQFRHTDLFKAQLEFIEFTPEEIRQSIHAEQPDIRRGIIRITAFGSNFMKACL